MKSITIKDRTGKILIKIIDRKDGIHKTVLAELVDLRIIVRDDNNKIIHWEDQR